MTPQEADRLAANRRFRVIPTPPGDVLVRDPQDDLDYREVIAETVAPHWNSAVAMLASGTDGYLALVTLRDRLKGRLAEERRGDELDDLLDHIRARVLAVLRKEADAHGAETNLLASSLALSQGSDHKWVSAYRTADVATTQADPPSLYCLHDAETLARVADYKALLGPHGFDESRTLTQFDRDATWASCIGQVAQRLRLFKRSTAWEARAEVVQFRLSVIDQVLREHEVLGYVGVYGESPRLVELDDEQETFLRAALRALKLVDKKKDKPTWFAIQTEMQWLTGRSRNWLERVAQDRFNAFEKGSERGRLPAHKEKARYKLFRQQIERWARVADVEGFEERGTTGTTERKG